MGVTLFPEVGFAPGMMMPYAGATAPDGWLLCDGAFLLRADYPALFAVLGTTFNLPTDTDATRFRLPDLKGRVIVGVDAAQTEFDLLAKTGGSKTSTAAHTHATAHTHSMNSVDTNHAHNVYTRNADSGTVSSWHTHNYDHWHGARIGNVSFNFAGTHSHHDRAGYAAEGPWEDFRQPGATIPVNVDGTGAGGTGNPSANHTHNYNHDHPSTNYQSESPWAGTYSHAHTTNTQSTSTSGASSAEAASGNLQPYMAMHYLIKT